MRKRIIVAGFMAVLLLAAVTLFVAAVQPFAVSAAPQAASQAAPPQQSGATEDIEATQAGEVMYIEVSHNINGEELSGGVFVHFEDPAELPAEEPALFGVFAGRSGDTLTLGTGSIAVTVDVEQINDQEPVTTGSATYDGDEVDVLLTGSTVFYEDTTAEPQIGQEEIDAGEITITRTLEAGSADALGADMVLRVWGTMVDGQLAADIVVYEPIG